MKKWLFILALFLIPNIANAQFGGPIGGGSGAGWQRQASCTTVIAQGAGCYDTTADKFYIGNGISAVEVAGGAQGPAGPGYTTTSVTSNTPGTGTKNFSVTVPATGLGYTPGLRIRAASAATPTTTYIEGTITSYSAGALTITADAYAGTGAHTDWNIGIAGLVGVIGATGPQGPAGADGTGTGDVSGPSSVADGTMALFDSTTGKKIKAGSAPFNPASPGTIGGTTPGSGKFSDVSIGTTGLSTVSNVLTSDKPFAVSGANGSHAALYANTGDPTLTPSEGMFAYDLTAHKFRFYNSSGAWADWPEGSGSVSDTAYNSTTWQSETTTAPSAHAVSVKIESIESEISGITAGTKTWAYKTSDFTAAIGNGYFLNGSAGLKATLPANSVTGELSFTNTSANGFYLWPPDSSQLQLITSGTPGSLNTAGNYLTCTGAANSYGSIASGGTSAWRWVGASNLTCADGGAACLTNTAEISYSSTTPFTVGDADRTITDSCTSGTPSLSVDAGSSTYCSIVAGAVHALAAGSCEIWNTCPSGSGHCTGTAQQTITVSAGSGQWYYDNVDNSGNSSFPDSRYNLASAPVGIAVDGLSGKTIKKVKVTLTDKGSATACKAAIYSGKTMGSSEVSNGVQSTLMNGDVEITVTDYLASGRIAAYVDCNDTWTAAANNSYGRTYLDSVDYASFPPSTLPAVNWDGSRETAIAVWAE